MTREGFERDLQALQDDLLHMGDLVDAAIGRSIEALKDRNLALADAVIKSDNAIDALHLDLEERCIRLMATQQPMARDLRLIASVWAMTIDLERMADHAEDISKIARRVAEQPLLKPLIDVPRMADMVREMLREGLDSFVRRDTAIAEEMAKSDDAVDHLYGQIFRELLTYMIEDPRNIERATNLLLVGQHIERMGDHATNLGERVIYMVTGTLTELNA